MGRRADRRRRNRRSGQRRGRSGFRIPNMGVVLGSLVLAVVVVMIYLLWQGGSPALAFDKLHADLGTVRSDQEGIQTFLVMNRGSSALEIGTVDIVVEQGCDQVTTTQNAIEIEAGGQALLPVHLGPHLELGPHRLRLNVASNDPSRPSSTLSLSFNVTDSQQRSARGPRLAVDKEFIDIGDVPYDWPMYEQFTLRNTGDAPLDLYGIPIVRVEEGC